MKMQIEAGKHIDFSKAYSISEFNEQSILFDLNYFKYYFLNRLDIQYDEKALQDNFDKLAARLAKNGIKNFMFRDFQARNILVKNEEVYFIDYQGGRKGAMQYDVASLLWQAKAQIPNEHKTELLRFYIEEVAKSINIDKQEFENEFWIYLYIRILQTLGAYGNRGLIEKKRHFIESIPFQIQNLEELSQTHDSLSEYSELRRVIAEICKFKKDFETVKYDQLTVNVMSFGFKHGLPEDKTENGGGFIFDCRGNHNPGRYEQYKKLTGRDKEVINFFKQNGDIDEFIENIKPVISPTIENYMQRGFTSLMICFGCTGGQHRSVYCAENIARFIHQKYGIRVILKHREQNIEERFGF
ncbi:MAG: phosphotransferase [Bacteroidales bacterium]|nr:phosphotransferase [Bacteroidales bacterium]